VRRREQYVVALAAMLLEHPQGIPTGQALARLGQRMGLSEAESSGNPKGKGTRFACAVSWVAHDMRQAGWLTNRFGVWQLSETGRARVGGVSDALDQDCAERQAA
jgi:Mrr restriction endonuclease-like protein